MEIKNFKVVETFSHKTGEKVYAVSGNIDNPKDPELNTIALLLCKRTVDTSVLGINLKRQFNGLPELAVDTYIYDYLLEEVKGQIGDVLS